jgi:hypothetical protein
VDFAIRQRAKQICEIAGQRRCIDRTAFTLDRIKVGTDGMVSVLGQGLIAHFIGPLRFHVLENLVTQSLFRDGYVGVRAVPSTEFTVSSVELLRARLITNHGDPQRDLVGCFRH